LPLLHNSGIAMPSFIELAGAENAEGVIFPMGKLVAVEALPADDPQKAVIEQFVTDYRAATGKEPSHFAAHSWDAIQLVLQALRTLPPEELTLLEQRSLVRDHLENIKGFVGIDGIYNLSPVNHVGLSEKDVVLVRIVNGKWEYLPEEQW
ncbi:MAG: ABC transporter substrate-binding protein, partial [Chloroflexi bacterium]|nr:ABC transporter substrate-binding protein [Chloroflexota bacterium]